FDAIAAGAQHAHEGVAEHGVAQVADVGGLVGVDVGVLDDDLLARALDAFGRAGEQRCAVRAAVEADVDVAVAGDLHRLDATDGADLFGELGGNLLGRLAQLLGELEGGGERNLAELALARLLDVHGQLDAVANEYVRAKGARNLLFNGMEHGKLRV